MAKLLDNWDYINLGATDLMKKAAELIKKREDEIDRIILKQSTNPQIEIEHDIMKAEGEYDNIRVSDRLRNKLRSRR